jgi:hypothetical protein
MNIDLKELLELTRQGTPAETPFRVGTCYLIRTVTHYAVGRVKCVVGGFLVLEDSSWVADTGRFHDTLTRGELSEVEPIPGDHIIGTGAVVDAMEWIHKLPTEQK